MTCVKLREWSSVLHHLPCKSKSYSMHKIADEFFFLFLQEADPFLTIPRKVMMTIQTARSTIFGKIKCAVYDFYIISYTVKLSLMVTLY